MNRTNKEIIYVELNKNIPVQKMALEKLENYRKHTGLSKKDALIFMLLAFQESEESVGTVNRMQLHDNMSQGDNAKLPDKMSQSEKEEFSGNVLCSEANSDADIGTEEEDEMKDGGTKIDRKTTMKDGVDKSDIEQMFQEEFHY